MRDNTDSTPYVTTQMALAATAASNTYQDIVIRSILLFGLCLLNVVALMFNRLELLRQYQLVFQVSLCMSFMLMLMFLSSMEARVAAIKTIEVQRDREEAINWLMAYKAFREKNCSYMLAWVCLVGLDLASLGDILLDIDNSDFILAGTLIGILIKISWGIHMTYYHNKLAKKS